MIYSRKRVHYLKSGFIDTSSYDLGDPSIERENILFETEVTGEIKGVITLDGRILQNKNYVCVEIYYPHKFEKRSEEPTVTRPGSPELHR